MEFAKLLETVGDEPVFETALLLAGNVDPAHVQRQLSRWTTAGWLYQLRRGVYSLAIPYQKQKPHPFLIANAMVNGSYVSLQTVLAYYGFIPEVTAVTTSVTTGRPAQWDTPLGRYEFRHIKQKLFYGFEQIEVDQGQTAFVATPEKALLDLIHLHPGGDEMVYLEALRLQAYEGLDLVRMAHLAERAGSPKLLRGAQAVEVLAQQQTSEYEVL